MTQPERGGRQGILAFQIEEAGTEGRLTSYAGLPMVAETFRALGLDQAVEQEVQVKGRARGLSEAQMVESFCLLLAAGGECLEDFELLRADGGLAELVGHALPAPETARQFLYRFHDQTLDAQRAAHQARTGEASNVPEEPAPLRGLAAVNRRSRRCPRRRGVRWPRTPTSGGSGPRWPVCPRNARPRRAHRRTATWRSGSRSARASCSPMGRR